MKLRDIDLNLFVVFDAIYTERNLTRAGDIIGITQPAVSSSLSRLRNLFNDPMFVRTAEGMVPTPVSQNIVGSVRQALGLIRSSVQKSELFDAATADKKFRVSMRDITQSTILPQLFDHIKTAAPNISVDCYHVRRRGMNIELASGNLDLAVDIPLTPDPQIKHAPLFDHPYVCVIRQNHGSIDDRMDLQAYLSLSHIHISSRRGGLGHVDLALGRISKRRHITLRAQHYLATPGLIAGTDLALTVPQVFADFLASSIPIKYFKLPFEIANLANFIYWHESKNQDPANIWMRELILTLPANMPLHTRDIKSK